MDFLKNYIEELTGDFLKDIECDISIQLIEDEPNNSCQICNGTGIFTTTNNKQFDCICKYTYELVY